MTEDKGPKIGVVIGTGASGARSLAKLSGKPILDMKPTDQIRTAPHIEHDNTRVWRCQLPPVEKREAAIASWVVEAPWAHPAWHSYAILLYHLRDYEGQERPARINRPNATHEICVLALNSNKDRNPFIETGIPAGHVLYPPNFIGQIVEITDELAIERVRKTIALIVAKKLDPDTDAREQWIELFGDYCMKERSKTGG